MVLLVLFSNCKLFQALHPERGELLSVKWPWNSPVFPRPEGLQPVDLVPVDLLPGTE